MYGQVVPRIYIDNRYRFSEHILIYIARKNETYKAKIKFPEEICDALSRYFEKTSYWTNEEWKKEVISEYIIKVTESWLRETSNSQEAIDDTIEEMKDRLKILF